MENEHLKKAWVMSNMHASNFTVENILQQNHSTYFLITVSASFINRGLFQKIGMYSLVFYAKKYINPIFLNKNVPFPN